MNTMGRALLETFRFTNASFEWAVDDLDHERLLHRTRDGRGPSIFWHLGHVLHYRVIALRRLGAGIEIPYGEMFAEEASADGAGYPSLDELRARWTEVHAELERTLAAAPDDVLESTYHLPDGRESSRTLLAALAFYAWHEAMHMGGVTSIRVELGAPSLAERAFGRR